MGGSSQNWTRNHSGGDNRRLGRTSGNDGTWSQARVYLSVADPAQLRNQGLCPNRTRTLRDLLRQAYSRRPQRTWWSQIGCELDLLVVVRDDVYDHFPTRCNDRNRW